MSEYVITEEQLKEHTKLCVSYGATDNVRTVGDLSMKLDEMDKTIRSRPLSSELKAERERVLKPFEQIMNDLHDLESCVIKFHLKVMIESLRSEQP